MMATITEAGRLGQMRRIKPGETTWNNEVAVTSAQRWMTLLFGVMCGYATAQQCSYESWRWNVQRKQPELFEKIVKPYSAVIQEERDADSGCSVCEEDQQTIRIGMLPEFKMCRHYATQIKQALTVLQQQGVKFESLTGYRVGRTRGKVDDQQRRTQFSNHSFGVALDINAEHNGLYDHCFSFGPHCVLLRGGPWRPNQDTLSLRAEGSIVRALKSIGLKWGGEIAGKQKDYMHFSPSGY